MKRSLANQLGLSLQFLEVFRALQVDLMESAVTEPEQLAMLVDLAGLPFIDIIGGQLIY